MINIVLRLEDTTLTDLKTLKNAISFFDEVSINLDYMIANESILTEGNIIEQVQNLFKENDNVIFVSNENKFSVFDYYSDLYITNYDMLLMMPINMISRARRIRLNPNMKASETEMVIKHLGTMYPDKLNMLKVNNDQILDQNFMVIDKDLTAYLSYSSEINDDSVKIMNFKTLEVYNKDLVSLRRSNMSSCKKCLECNNPFCCGIPVERNTNYVNEKHCLFYSNLHHVIGAYFTNFYVNTIKDLSDKLAETTNYLKVLTDENTKLKRKLLPKGDKNE